MRIKLPHALLLLLTTFASAQALADEPRLAVAASARPLAIGRFNLLLGAEPGVVLGGASSVYQMWLPLRFGITEDFELFAGPVAQTVAPVLHDPALGVLYRFLHGPVEIGARVAGDLSIFDANKSVGLQLGVPLRIHAGSALAIDVGAHALIGVIPQTSIGLLVPAGVSFNITQSLFIGAASGVRVPDLSNAGALAVPLAATAGYTIPWGDRPFIDLAVRAGWDDARASLSTFGVFGSGKIYFYI